MGILLQQNIAFGSHELLKEVFLDLNNSGAPAHHLLKLYLVPHDLIVLLDDLGLVLELQALVGEAEEVGVVLDQLRVCQDRGRLLAADCSHEDVAASDPLLQANCLELGQNRHVQLLQIESIFINLEQGLLIGGRLRIPVLGSSGPRILPLFERL